MIDTVTKAVIRLFDRERFYAELVLQMDRIITNRIPTAGVCIKENIQLLVNPDFFENLSLDEQVGVLIHEAKHVLHDHIPRVKTLAPEVYAANAAKDVGSKHKMMNIAADIAINPGIQNIPEGAVYPKMFDLVEGETFEFYAEKLKDNELAKKMSAPDEHATWGESEGEPEILKEKLKQAVNKAAEKARAAGKMTSNDELLVDRLNYQPKDWKRDLSRFAARMLQTAIESSKKKRNRRYGIMYPGTVKYDELVLGVAIDTSGSVSDEALSQFMAEIGVIAKHAKVIVVEADSEVKNSYVFDPKKNYKVSGRGGTAYQPAFDHFTKNEEVDGVIYFGDMDCFDEKLIKPRYPVLWAIVGSQRPPADWGAQTKVEVKRK